MSIRTLQRLRFAFSRQRRFNSSSSSSSPSSSRTHLLLPGAVKSPITTTPVFTPATTEPLPTYRVISPSGQPLLPSFSPSLSQSQIIKAYRDLLFISELDTVMLEAQRQGRISFYMVSAGEEAVAVGSGGVLDKDDVVFCQYREQGVFRARGWGIKEFAGQLVGARGEPGRGRNMPVHYGSRKLNMHTISSPLATQLPQAAGAAYALKLQRMTDPTLPERVVITYFGDGAASEGDFHAALNIAATRGCPVIFLCRNNGYAISTGTPEQYKGDGIAARGAGYGIESVRVDGNDFWAVREVVGMARKKALEGGGRPILVEAMTYRVSHHSTSDDSFAYREKMEVDDWKRRDDPIGRLRKWMELNGIWSDAEESKARKELRREIVEGFREAEGRGWPGLRSMFEGVYKEISLEVKGQMTELERVLREYPDEYDISMYENGVNDLKKI